LIAVTATLKKSVSTRLKILQNSWQICNGPDDKTVLEGVSLALLEAHDPGKGVAAANKIVDPFLKKTLGNMKYRFVEIKYLKGKEIASRGKFEDAKDVGVAVKSYGGYTYKLYVWE